MSQAGRLISRLTAHVGRAVLAQAAQFKTEAPVVWEYVVNSLQYVDPGVQPKVEVMVKHGSITISSGRDTRDGSGPALPTSSPCMGKISAPRGPASAAASGAPERAQPSASPTPCRVNTGQERPAQRRSR